MKLADLIGKSCVIWGTGKEGLSAAAMLAAHTPPIPFSFVAEQDGPDTITIGDTDAPVQRTAAGIRQALNSADIIIKSPGVSLYHPDLAPLRVRGVIITSLLNLFLAEHPDIKVILVTGTKGKSTTSTLLAHTLNTLGHPAIVMGNIGTPLGYEPLPDTLSYLILETSSYQAATLSEPVDVAVMTSLYPEHLDWHKSLPAYYRDKANALQMAKRPVIAAEAYQTLRDVAGITLDSPVICNTPVGIHAIGADIYLGPAPIGRLDNAFLARSHNLNNVCTVLAALGTLGLNLKTGLAAMTDFKGLPHRQYELGTKDDILYVDDSISTTPESTIAALEAYAGRPVSLIVGGQDRGIPYDKLVTYAHEHTNIQSILCLGPAGERLHSLMKAKAHPCPDMDTAVRMAQDSLKGQDDAVILLSPAAPSYGMFKDYIDRARAFAIAADIKA